MRTVDIIILQLAAISPKTCFGAVFRAEVEMSLKCIVKENTVCYALVYADVKRNAAVKRVLVPGK